MILVLANNKAHQTITLFKKILTALKQIQLPFIYIALNLFFAANKKV